MLSGRQSQCQHLSRGVSERLSIQIAGRPCQVPRVGGHIVTDVVEAGPGSRRKVGFRGPVANLAARLNTDLTQYSLSVLQQRKTNPMTEKRKEKKRKEKGKELITQQFLITLPLFIPRYAGGPAKKKITTAQMKKSRMRSNSQNCNILLSERRLHHQIHLFQHRCFNCFVGII